MLPVNAYPATRCKKRCNSTLPPVISLRNFCQSGQSPPGATAVSGRSASAAGTGLHGRVGVWRSGCRPSIAVAAPFVWRFLTGRAAEIRAKLHISRAISARSRSPTIVDTSMLSSRLRPFSGRNSRLGSRSFASTSVDHIETGATLLPCDINLTTESVGDGLGGRLFNRHSNDWIHVRLLRSSRCTNRAVPY